eukprot:COSAG02_NODE_521_length_20750_cov_10.721079_3_plen_89_part_00
MRHYNLGRTDEGADCCARALSPSLIPGNEAGIVPQRISILHDLPKLSCLILWQVDESMCSEAPKRLKHCTKCACKVNVNHVASPSALS